MVSYAAALVPVSLLPTAIGIAGRIYFAGAVVLGLACCSRWPSGLRSSAPRNARGSCSTRSLIYLPVLWVLMLANRA